MKLKEMREIQKELHDAEKRLKAFRRLHKMGVVDMQDIEILQDEIDELKLFILVGDNKKNP